MNFGYQRLEGVKREKPSVAAVGAETKGREGKVLCEAIPKSAFSASRSWLPG